VIRVAGGMSSTRANRQVLQPNWLTRETIPTRVVRCGLVMRTHLGDAEMEGVEPEDILGYSENCGRHSVLYSRSGLLDGKVSARSSESLTRLSAAYLGGGRNSAESGPAMMKNPYLSARRAARKTIVL